MACLLLALVGMWTNLPSPASASKLFGVQGILQQEELKKLQHALTVAEERLESTDFGKAAANSLRKHGKWPLPENVQGPNAEKHIRAQKITTARNPEEHGKVIDLDKMRSRGFNMPDHP
eukprot:SAG31_NODE_450_length_15512_cov_5.788555_15_plen_119_part_00